MTDKNDTRKNKCRCGNAVIELLEGTDRLSENIRRVKITEPYLIMGAYEELSSYLYPTIRNVESFCDIDAKEEQQHSMNALSRISEMRSTKDLAVFRYRRNDILNDLSKIKSGIKEKINNCSYP